MTAVSCKRCNGSGHIRKPSLLSEYEACPDCDANGYLETAELEPDAKRWRCGARQRNIGPGIQECDWPVCGCDPYASKVLDAIEESGFKIVKA